MAMSLVVWLALRSSKTSDTPKIYSNFVLVSKGAFSNVGRDVVVKPASVSKSQPHCDFHGTIKAIR